MLNEEQERQKYIWDYEAAKHYYYEEGRKQGRKIGIALSAIERGLENELIEKMTGLSISEIEELRNEQ